MSSPNISPASGLTTVRDEENVCLGVTCSYTGVEHDVICGGFEV